MNIESSMGNSIAPTTEAINQTFGKNIRLIRTEKHFTQEKFAKQLGITRAALASYEEYRATPALPVLVSISTLLEIDINTLLTPNLGR